MGEVFVNKELDFEGEITLNIKSPINEETLADIRDDEMEATMGLFIHTPKGKEVYFRKVVPSHWVDKGGGVAECSNCKKEIKTVASVHNYFNFCPFCGAIVQRGLSCGSD